MTHFKVALMYISLRKKLHYYPSSIITHKNLSTTPFITCSTCYSFSCFFLAYPFVLRENFNFSCFTRRLFFYLACAQFICKRIYFIRRKTNAIPMLCRCKRFITKWADNITESDKGKTSTKACVPFQADDEARPETKEEKSERSGTKEGPTGRL